MVCDPDREIAVIHSTCDDPILPHDPSKNHLILQLELNFQEQLHLAQSSPETANWEKLSTAFTTALDHIPPSQQLAFAGDAIAGLADVVALQAEAWSEVLKTPSEEGPVLSGDALIGLVRQSMRLDLSGLVAQRASTTRRTFPKAEEFFAEVGDQETLLKALGVEEPEPEQALEVIEEEDVAAWVDEIATVLEQEGGQMGLGKLLQLLSLSEGMVFLGLLLGGFELESQSDRFYEGRIVVCSVLCDDLRSVGDNR